MITRGVLLVVAIGLIWTAVAFVGAAVYLALTPDLGAAWAAAVTAFVLFAVLGLGVLLHMAFAKPLPLVGTILAPPQPAQTSSAMENEYMPALARLAKDHPLLAVGCAAVLGVAESIHAANRR